ncbi:MAG TPA: PEP-CTERM sorting domain-containing protein [Phycisphaerae bacterium]|nr:PEP-CTERM sorting domain-containing protein [Phycisphaerae bacterium]
MMGRHGIVNCGRAVIALGAGTVAVILSVLCSSASAATTAYWDTDQTISSAVTVAEDRLYVRSGSTITVTDGGILTLPVASGQETNIGITTNGNLLIEGAGQVLGGASSVNIGRYTSGSMTMTGGSFAMTTGTVDLARGAGGAGTLDVSGGTLSLRGVRACYQGNGTSTALLRVTGSAATITMDSLDLSYVAASTTTLAFVLDDTTKHISTISTAMANLGSTVIDMGTASGFAPTSGQVFDLVTITGSGAFNDISALSLAAGDVGSWTLQTSADKKTLQAVAVPEPATMALLGLGILGIVARKRRSGR